MSFESELETIVKHRRGQLGMMGSYASLVGQQLLFFDLPAWYARPWVVTLVAMRYQSGPIPASNFFTGQPPPPDNVALAQGAGQYGQGGPNNGGDAGVTIEWGVDGASERVVIDYPWSGSSFEVVCSSLKLRLNMQGATGGVLLGAFCAPGTRDGALGLSPPRATYDVSIPPLTTAVVYVPARARYYSFALQTPVNVAGAIPFQLTQANSQGGSTPFRTDWDSVVDAAGGPYGALAGEYRFPIHPYATAIQINNLGSVTTLGAVISFEMDLG